MLLVVFFLLGATPAWCGFVRCRGCIGGAGGNGLGLWSDYDAGGMIAISVVLEGHTATALRVVSEAANFVHRALFIHQTGRRQRHMTIPGLTAFQNACRAVQVLSVLVDPAFAAIVLQVPTL